MAIKAKTTKAKTATKTEAETTEKIAALEKMTSISFRTRQLTKKKAEKIFSDMGISTSAALNMFLTQVVRDKGLPFTPTTRKDTMGGAKDDTDTAGYVALEELWEEL